MVSTRAVGVTIATLACVVLLCNNAFAQQQSGIAGLVRDTSGAVTPGVTVEVTSPALIEKVRTGVTDSEGRYNIVDLRPGTYAVSFVLPGFSVLKREGIVLTAGFTATVNAQMQVGALEETVTVTGASPLVDTQNVRRQQVVSSELLETLPTGTQTLNNLVGLTLGLTGNNDAAGTFATQVGSMGNFGGVGGSAPAFHGKTGTRVTVDGMGIQNMIAAGVPAYQVNQAMIQETIVQTSGMSAETTADGMVVNAIPKEGGNTFASEFFGLFSNDSLQANNLTDELRARGLTSANKVLKVYDGGGSLGGPLVKDKVWFFTAHRWWGNRNQVAGVFFNKNQGAPLYVPDPSRPSFRYETYQSNAVRVTWQVSQRNKINGFADVQDICICRYTQVDAPEAVEGFRFHPQGLYQLTWTSPISNKLLLDAGASMFLSKWPRKEQDGVSVDDIATLEQSTNFWYNARTVYNDPEQTDRYVQRVALSYVTGTHAFKTGVQVEQGVSNIGTYVHHDVNYRFNNGVPNQITQFATPYIQKARMKADMGIYVQDQWAIRRLTLNLGLRYDYFNGYVPPQQVPAPPSGWVAERNFAEVKNVPNWKDINPRVGASYDLFGTGRTALKFSLGRYVAMTAVAIPNALNPITTSVNTVTRAWTDANRNFIPDCDLRLRTANGECAAMSDPNFGGLNITTRYSDDVLLGLGARDYNWDMSAEMQHQLGSGMSVTGGYYRSSFGNFRVTDNLAVTPADYDPYCITAPTDSRLPNGGGYQVCGLYDIKPAKFGQVNNLVTQASNFGRQTRINNFFNASVNSRLGSGIRLGGGVDTGRTELDTCFTVDSPQQLLNCDVVTPFSAQTQFKAFGSYPLPGDFLVSGVFLNVSGVGYTAAYTVSNAAIAPSLGRNLAACGAAVTCSATATVPLVKDQTQFEPRRTQLDLRLSKMINVSPRVSLQLNLDAYNIFNSSAVLIEVGTYGPRWRLPATIRDARMFEFGGRLKF